MKRLLLALVLLSPASVFAGTIAVTGTVLNSNGSRFNGSVVMTLNYPATDTCSGNLVVPQSASFKVNNGTVASGARITPNDCLAPLNTIYVTQFFTSAGVLARQNNFSVTGTQFNLGTATPTALTSSNISFDLSSFIDLPNVNCDGFTGAEQGSKITACIASLPSTGGIANATAITLATWTTLVTISKANVTLILGTAPVSATAGILVTAQGVNLVFPGQQTPNITYAPAAGGSFIKFSNGASELFFGSVSGLSLGGTNGQKKIGIELVDTSNIHIENNFIQLSGSTANNEGIKLEGRESTFITGNYIQADQMALHVADNPNSTLDCDFLSLINNTWIGPLAGVPTKGTVEVDTGVNVFRLTMMKDVIIGGLGFRRLDTTTGQNSEKIALYDIGFEQGPLAGSFCIDWESTTTNTSGIYLTNIRCGNTQNGIKLRNILSPSIEGLIYDNVTGVALNVDSTVHDLHRSNIYVNTGGTITDTTTDSDGCTYIYPTKTCKAVTLTVTGGIVGTTTNDDAAAGIVGEFMSSTVASGSSVSLGSGTAAAITFITLTAGDWDVSGVAQYTPGAATSITQLFQGSGASNTCDSVPAGALGAPGTFTVWATAANVMGVIDSTWAIPTNRVSLSSTTKVCLIVRAGFTVSTLRGYGFISARRVR